MIESIIQFSIARRYLVLSFIALIFLAGIFSFKHLAIDAVPDITNVQVQINTQAPGFTPQETEQRITYPVETALLGIPKLSYTRSLSRYGLSQVTVVFDEGTDIYFARNLINQKLTNIKDRLPPGVEPQMGPISTGLGEIFMYAVEADSEARMTNGESYNAIALREIQDWIIKPQLAQVKGVTEINSIGGYSKQYHVLPSPTKLLFHRVSLKDISKALLENNQNAGAGYLEVQGQQVLVRSPGQIESIDAIRDIVVTERSGVPIKIGDVAEVAIGKELRSGAATLNGEESVLGTAMMLIGENSREVSKAVAEKLEDIQSSLPAGIRAVPVYDRTLLVDKAVATVSKNLLEGALLVIAVLFLLLGNLRAALITALVIPLTMLMTISGMVKAGVSANLMSLGALDFGLIVDGTVIIIENTIRRLALAQEGGSKLSVQDRLHTVYEATVEVIRPSLFGVAIITVVYIPIFSLTGVEGKMFHPMAATVVMALLSAMLFSLTIVPAAVAIFLSGKVQKKESVLITKGKSLYEPILRVAFTFRWPVLGLSAVLVVFAAWLASNMGAEFIPQLDEGDIALHAIRIPGTGIEQSVEMQGLLEKKIKALPEVERVFARLGTAEVATDPMPPNMADNYVMLKPRAEWPDPSKSKAAFLDELKETVETLPGNNYEFTQPIQMRFNELISGVRADLAVKVFGDDLNELHSTAQKIATQLRALDGASDVHVEQVSGLPTLSIIPNQIALGRYGLSIADLQQWLATAIGGLDSGVVFEGDRRFSLVVRLPEALRQDIDQLKYLPLQLANGEYLPLGEIAEIKQQLSPAQISRENGKRRVVVSVNVRGRDLASFVEDAKSTIRTHVTVPAGYWLDFGGTFKQLKSASERLTWVVPITLMAILGILVMAFSSIKDALIIFSGIPFALTGGVFSLYLRDMPLSISAAIGFIALSGVAVLNGLVMVSFIRELKKERPDLLQAIIEGAVTRLRPVLMTALVASLGFIPMALNTGTGAEVQRPLATVVIGGILSSTLLTLVVLPLLYHWAYGRSRPSAS